MPTGKHELIYTNHAKREAEQEPKGGRIPLPSELDFGQVRLIEVEQDDYGLKPNKFVVRTGLDDKRDLIMAVLDEDGEIVVKSVWANWKNDNHSTLNKGRYVRR
jgi:hypothetical protein